MAGGERKVCFIFLYLNISTLVCLEYDHLNKK